MNAATLLIGGGALIFGMFLALAFASQQIQIGLQASWPYSFIPLILSFLAMVVGVRLTVIGVCILVPRFARWYLA